MGGTTDEVVRILEITANGHLAAAVAILYGPFAPIKRVGRPRCHVTAIGLAGAVVVDSA